MSARDVEILRARLQAIARAALRLAGELEDLHEVAYTPAVAGHDKVSGGGVSGLETVGDPRARALWRRLDELRDLELAIVTLEQAVGNLLASGPSPEPTRGSLIPKREFRAALRRQRQRDARGEYTPRRNVDQPPYPGTEAS